MKNQINYNPNQLIRIIVYIIYQKILSYNFLNDS